MDTLALLLDALHAAHGHGQDGHLRHAGDHRHAGVDGGHPVGLAAARALGQDAHELPALQHAHGALDGGHVGRVALHGEGAHPRERLAEQAAGVVEEAVAAHEAHPLLRARGQVHEDDVEERRVVADDERPFRALEGAQLVAVVHPVAEQQLAQAAHHHVGRVAEPVRDLVFAGLAAQIHVPHLGVF